MSDTTNNYSTPRVGWTFQNEHVLEAMQDWVLKVYGSSYQYEKEFAKTKDFGLEMFGVPLKGGA